MNAINKLIIVLAMGLMLTACSSPEEQKIEKETGYKLSEIKNALEIKKDMKEMDDNFGFFDALMNPAKAQELKKKYNKLEEKAKEYKPIYKALDKFLEKLEEDLENSIKSDPQMQAMVADIKAFIAKIDDDKIVDERLLNASKKTGHIYEDSIKEQYASKMQKLDKKFNEIMENFLKQYKSIKDITDKMSKPELISMFDIEEVDQKDSYYKKAMSIKFKKNVKKLEEDLENSIKSDPQMQAMVADIKAFIAKIDDDKIREERRSNTWKNIGHKYEDYNRKQYASKMRKLNKKFNEIIENFLKQHEDVKDQTDKMSKPELISMFDIKENYYIHSGSAESYLEEYGIY